MIGDKLASGAPSATFPGPRLKFDEAEMQRDLRDLPAQAFLDKYMITQREYDLLIQSDGSPVNMLAKSIQDHLEIIERLTAQDKKQEESLKRDCPISPYLAYGLSGRIIACRDQPKIRRSVSKLALPRDLRKQRDLLPSTGHVVKATIMDAAGTEIGNSFVGRRILWGGMSGQALCFDGYPVFIALDLAEVIGFIEEDAKIIEEELEPLRQ